MGVQKRSLGEYMGKTTVIRFIPDDKAFAKAYAEFIKRKKERGEECS